MKVLTEGVEKEDVYILAPVCLKMTKPLSDGVNRKHSSIRFYQADAAISFDITDWRFNSFLVSLL